MTARHASFLLLAALSPVVLTASEPSPRLWRLACREAPTLRFSTLFTAQNVRDELAREEGLERAIRWCRETGVTRVYLESFRDGHTADRDTLRAAKRRFREAGLLTSGCITTTGLGKKAVRGWMFPCFSDRVTLERLEREFRFAAGLFDEIMIDDFFATKCECEDCDTARGERSWSAFRLELLRDVSRHRVIEPARDVNPNVRLILKYPQWYEHFRERGYDVDPVGGQTAMFDSIWVGTETRDPDNERWGKKSQYEAYFLMRWLGAVGGSKCGGGWFDPFGTSPPTYLEQARQTVLAGAREVMLFCYGALQRGTGPANVAALRDELPGLFELARIVRRRAPRGIAAPRPIAVDAPAGEDGAEDRWIWDFVGLLGMPLVPAPALRDDALAAFAPLHVMSEPEMTAKIVRMAESGRPVVVTGRLADALGWRDARPESARVLEVPRDPWKLFDVPRDELGALRRAVLEPFGITLDAPSRVALYLFGDDVVVVENFADGEARVSIGAKGTSRLDLFLTLPSREPDATSTAGKTSCVLPPRSLAAFRLSKEKSESARRVLFDFGGNFDTSRLRLQDASAQVSSGQDRRALRVRTGTKNRWPGVTLAAPDGAWDLSTWRWLSARVKNAGEHSIQVSCRVDNAGADGRENCLTERITLRPGQSGSLTFPLTPRRLGSGGVEFFGMRGAPPVTSKLDPSRVTQILFFVADPDREHVFDIERVVTGGARARTARRGVDQVGSEAFFPMIDELGQYAHDDWPGKSHSANELRAAGEQEERDIARHPGPADRNRWGGWTRGPRLEATGFFRVDKIGNAWWLVDPEGRLFWSHGIDCVHPNAATPITDRGHWFRKLPDPSGTGEFAECYGTSRWAPHGYYAERTPYRTFDFFAANQIRKYDSPDWRARFSDLTHRRLRSWGLNTIGNWSERSIREQRRTPYTANVSSGGKRIEGSSGYWRKFPDVFDPSFATSLADSLARESGRSADDPWCIGYFVDNELSWGDEYSLAEGALASPPAQSAKGAFAVDLKAKYETIQSLNAAWGTKHESWDALVACRTPPDRGRAKNDLLAFADRIAETYFRTVRDAVKRVAPRQLYLGCRFAWVNDRMARAAAKFCDVVSYNRYAYSVADHRLPDGIDRPTIIGEFHFGALDRGMFHTGLRKARDQSHRAELYREYVLGALRNPQIVGTHWFQYKDQATTGRGDGENYQIGFVDVCDRPYPEIIRTCREVGERIYDERFGAAAIEPPAGN